MAKPVPEQTKKPIPSYEWRERFALTGKRVDLRSPANLLLVLREHPALKNSIAWNELLCDIEIGRDIPGVGKAGDYLDLSRRQLLTVFIEQQEGLQASYRMLDNTLLVVAKENPTNAIKRYLEGIKWDGEPRLATWLREYMGVAGTDGRIASAGPRFLLSAVTRIMAPGSGIDSLWIWQATNSETIHEALEVLFPKYYHRWSDPTLFMARTIQEVRGKWCVNILDIDQCHAQLLIRIKSIGRRLEDTAESPINRYVLTVPRTCSYVAVTDKLPDQKVLKEANAGDPFYECLPCFKVHLSALERDRDQLFAEAMHLYNRKRSHLRRGWRLIVVPDPEREKVAAYISGKTEVTLREVVEFAGKEYIPGPKGLNFRYGKILRSLNMQPIRLNPWEPEAKTVYRIVD